MLNRQPFRPLLSASTTLPGNWCSRKSQTKRNPEKDLDLSSVIAALTLLELNLEAPASFASAFQTLANNGKIGGLYDRDLNKRLLGVYYKATQQAKQKEVEQKTQEALLRQQDNQLHQELFKRVEALQKQSTKSQRTQENAMTKLSLRYFFDQPRRWRNPIIAAKTKPPQGRLYFRTPMVP